MVFTYTLEEAQRAHCLWKAKGRVKDLCDILHLRQRHHLYLVAEREGWEPRKTAGYPSTQVQKLRRAIHLIVEDASDRQMGHYQDAARKNDDVFFAEMAALPHTCTTCGYRVSDDPEYTLQVGPDFYHRTCVNGVAA